VRDALSAIAAGNYIRAYRLWDMDRKDTRRGYVDTDEREFSEESLAVLKRAQEEIHWLLNRGYHIKNAVTFIGNHYMLSNRQRTALTRATSSSAAIKERKNKEVFDCYNQIVCIDGFNLIITLEVALSGSTLIRCMDGTIRDLAGLRGTYRLIDKTDAAIMLIGDRLKSMNITGLVFYLDAPVSNTGRLKTRIVELLGDCGYDLTVELVNNVDKLLKEKANMVTSDAIILNECVSWINLAADIISERISMAKYVDLGPPITAGVLHCY